MYLSSLGLAREDSFRTLKGNEVLDKRRCFSVAFKYLTPDVALYTKTAYLLNVKCYDINKSLLFNMYRQVYWCCYNEESLIWSISTKTPTVLLPLAHEKGLPYVRVRTCLNRERFPRGIAFCVNASRCGRVHEVALSESPDLTVFCRFLASSSVTCGCLLRRTEIIKKGIE